MRDRRGLWMIAACVCVTALAGSPAMGWWDTIVKKWEHPPTVAEHVAEQLPDVPAEAIVDDETTATGHAVVMREAGPTLRFERDLEPSVYSVYIVGRSPREADQGDPASLAPFYFHVTVTDSAGASETIRVRAAYQHIYTLVYGHQEMARAYFRVTQPGVHKVEVAVGHDSTAESLLVSRLDLIDVLGNTAGRGLKTERTITSDERLRQLRGGEIKPVEHQPDDVIIARAQAYFASFPPFNAPRHASANPAHYHEADHFPAEALRSGWKMNALDQPWQITHDELGVTYSVENFRTHQPIHPDLPDDGWGVRVENVTQTWGEQTPMNTQVSVIAPLFDARTRQLVTEMHRKAEQFERTGDEQAGLDGAALLVAFAYHYPAIDFRSQAAWTSSYTRFGFTNHIGGGGVEPGLREGWAVSDYVRSYDRLFDYIKDNQALADFLATKIDGVETPEDVIAFLDTNLLQRVADVIMRGDVAGDPLKMSRALTMAALCQGVNDVSQQWVDTLFDEIPMGMIEPGSLEDMAFGDLGRDGLVSKGSGGYSKASIMAFLEVTEMLNNYRCRGGTVPVDLTDANLYPWFARAFDAPFNLRVAGGWVPLLGDYGDPLRLREEFYDGHKGSKPFYFEAWRLTRDPRFAFEVVRHGRTDETDEQWAELEAAAATTRDPLNTLPPRVLDDLGLAILESGQQFDDYREKRAATLRYGNGHTHGHNDGLDVALWGKGTRAITDLAARAGSPNPRLHKMHNTVEVDRTSLNNGDDISPGYGWLEAFAPSEGVQYTSASQRGRSHPQLEIYRRGIALIDVGEQDSYLFDVFRVRGGEVHTWSAHANQNDTFEVNAELAPATSEEAQAYLEGYKTPATELHERFAVPELLPQPMQGVAPEALVATWRLHPRAEQAFLKAELGENEKVYARWRLFGHEGSTLYAANGWSDRYSYDMSFLYVQDQDAGEQGNVFLATAEVYQSEPVVQSARQLAVQGADRSATAPVAMQVELPDQTRDTLLAAMGDGTVHDVEGGIRFDGEFGFVRHQGDRLERAMLVGGTTLTGPGYQITLPRGTIEGDVIATDPAANTVDVAGDFANVNLVGQLVLFQIPNGRTHAHTVKAATPLPDGVRLELADRLKIFQSAFIHVDEAAQQVSVVAEPYALKGDQRAYDHTQVSNESLTKRWSASVVTDSRWMKLLTPVTDADLPDADGDGRRVLRLVGGDADGENAGKTLIELQITRVDEDQDIIYFATPEPPYDIGGWSYVGRTIESESGRKWQGTYPGIEYKVQLDGPVTADDFDDANGDGRRVLSIHRFGAGAKLVAPARVSVQRNADGSLAIESIGPADVQIDSQN